MMPTDRFTKMQKVAIFLITLGEERTREILSDVDLDTVQQVNAAIGSLDKITAEEKAGVMLEFAHFFYEDKPITSNQSASSPSLSKSPVLPGPPTPPPTATQPPVDLGALGQSGDADISSGAEEQAILHTLEHLRRRLDPGKIDWGRAGYDFGDGFKGPSSDRG
ncbi:MAG: hypothetical protein HOM68_01290 [Gemmatimonadetes bacterium]|jgi:hypothetical protein|nr:hypothetical protein [Gemmatimonadota bacterium]MBT4609077.1 hypothetical protein [Gemmatimonadota bacterium]MBT5055145.1 hypothetical protein [Gemmatimonadota bacterium]MBT5144624.1 hypothetical protein [Gemmatimonadota bacterium]MBT5587415.1 hypothetical protein [Gemmatimonadota bacterium]